jgi:hypothetical protein
MANGTACMADAPDAAALARVINGLRSCDALALGSIAGGNGTAVNVITNAALAKMPADRRGNNTIARSREFITFAAGVPAWLLVDFDRKGMPPEISRRIEAAGGVWLSLLAVVPGLDKAARVIRASTSAGLSREDTGASPPPAACTLTYCAVTVLTSIAPCVGCTRGVGRMASAGI